VKLLSLHVHILLQTEGHSTWTSAESLICVELFIYLDASSHLFGYKLSASSGARFLNETALFSCMMRPTVLFPRRKRHNLFRALERVGNRVCGVHGRRGFIAYIFVYARIISSMAKDKSATLAHFNFHL
jgi:hypothetical protein